MSEGEVVTAVFKELVGGDGLLPSSLAQQCLSGCGFTVDLAEVDGREWPLEDLLKLAATLKQQGRWSMGGNVGTTPLPHVLLWVKVYASLAVGRDRVSVGALRAVLTRGSRPLTSGVWCDVCDKVDAEELSLCEFLQLCRAL